LRRSDETLVQGFVLYIAGAGDGFAACRGNLADQLVQLFLATCGDNELGAFRREQLRGGTADAGAGAGDDGDFVAERLHRVLHSVMEQ
jgi:hypothetical protein